MSKYVEGILDIDIKADQLAKMKGIDPKLDTVIDALIRTWRTNDMRIGTVYVEQENDSCLEIRFISRLKREAIGI